jgi:transcriptional regulator with XRE-family HTH domain
MATATPRNQGFRLNAETFAHQLALRALTARQLAELSGVNESTISLARHGRHISDRTLRRLSAALLDVPLLLGAELVVGSGETQ